MSKGYYSRSPEEFKEFLQKKRDGDKGKTRTRLILFFDVILLLFIFAVVARLLNPIAFTGQSESKEIRLRNLQLRLTADRESGKELPTFFLFFKNPGAETGTFPEKNETVQIKILTGEGLNCFSDTLKIPEKKIEPGKAEFYRYEPDSNLATTLPLECKTPTKSILNNITKVFRPEKKRKVLLEILRDKQNVSLEIPNF